MIVLDPKATVDMAMPDFNPKGRLSLFRNTRSIERVEAEIADIVCVSDGNSCGRQQFFCSAQQPYSHPQSCLAAQSCCTDVQFTCFVTLCYDQACGGKIRPLMSFFEGFCLSVT